jgi:hypothetical protein
VLGERGVHLTDIRVVQAGAHDRGFQVVVPDHLWHPLQPDERVLVGTQEAIALLGPQRLFVAVLRARQRQAEDPRSTPPTLRLIERRRSLEEIHLRLFARRVLHDVDQLGVCALEPPHVPPHRGVAVRVAHRWVCAQVLPDPLRRQPLAQTSLDLLTVRLGQPRRPMRRVRAGRQVGRF